MWPWKDIKISFKYCRGLPHQGLCSKQQAKCPKYIAIRNKHTIEPLKLCLVGFVRMYTNYLVLVS